MPPSVFFKAPEGFDHRLILLSTTESFIMADLKAQFEAAAASSKNLTNRPDNATMLKLYALFKQGGVGDNSEKKPGFGDMVGRAKWDAWNGVKGQSSDEAMQNYIDTVKELQG